MVNNYFRSISYALSKIDKDSIVKAARAIKDCEGRVFIFGNGGSAATASHFAQDLSKMCGINTTCLNDSVSSILAYGNDNGFDNVFKKQLENILTQKDIVIGISGSGNSQNVIQAIRYADFNGAYTIGIVGYDGGELKTRADASIHVEFDDMQICEDIHLIITHLICKL